MSTKRHSAVRPKSGKPSIILAPSPKRLAVLDLLQDGPLPSTYIKTWLETGYKHDGPRAYTYTDALLPKMDEAHLIGMPKAAKLHNVLYRPFVYENLYLADQMLVEAGLWHAPYDRSDQFKHRFARSVIRFSFDLAPREIPGLRLLKEKDILWNEKCPRKTREENHPSHVKLGEFTLKPDAPLFGYEYTAQSGKKSYIFFHGFEADRSTEQKAERADRKKSVTSMVRNWARYFGERIYASRYGLTQAFIPIITNSAVGMLNMMEVVRTECPPEQWDRFLFKHIPDFDDGIPPPTAHMVTEPWARVGAPPLRILEALQVTAERKSHDARRQDSPRGGVGRATA